MFWHWAGYQGCNREQDKLGFSRGLKASDDSGWGMRWTWDKYIAITMKYVKRDGGSTVSGST